MSTIIVLKDADTLLLATDSRYMTHDFSGIASDQAQKIFEIAPGTFVAPSGYLGACEFQLTKMRELVATLGTADIRVLGEALARESIPQLEQLAETLRSIQHVHAKIGQALDGERILHALVLAGRTADGSLGYVNQVYRIRGGRVVCEVDEYFGAAGRVHTTSGPPAQAAVAADPTILSGAPVEVVRKLLAALKRDCPNIGGPDQIIQISGGWARWISEPPAAAALSGPELHNADALFAGQATFGSVGGGKVIINSSGITLQDKITSPTATLSLDSSGVSIVKAGAVLTMDASGFSVAKGSSSVSVTASEVAITNGALSLTSGTVTINIDAPNLLKVSNSSSHLEFGCDGATLYALDTLSGFNSSASIAINLPGGVNSHGMLQLRHYNGTAISLVPILSSSATAGSAILPTNPVGFVELDVNGTPRKFPYYAQ